jgi:hypothetical protein
LRDRFQSWRDIPPAYLEIRAIGGRIGLLLEASALSVTSDERER